MSKAAQAPIEVAVLGQTFCDLVFEGAPLVFVPGTETYASNLVVSSGGAATRAVAAARLGASTALVSELSGDAFGQIIRAELEAVPNLNLDWCVEAASTPVSVALTSVEDRAFLTYDAGRTSPSITVDELPAASYLHVGLVEGLDSSIRSARSAGTSIVAGVGWDGTGAWPQEHLRALVDVDIFCPNAGEAMAYTGMRTLENAILALAPRVPLLIVTDGARGAWIAGRDVQTPELVPGFPTLAVDPTGAGDVFIAAVMVELARGADARQAVRYANAASALAVSAVGGVASAPDREAVAAFLSSIPNSKRGNV